MPDERAIRWERGNTRGERAKLHEGTMRRERAIVWERTMTTERVKWTCWNARTRDRHHYPASLVTWSSNGVSGSGYVMMELEG